jgi:flagellar basal body-associated protein FliL
VKPVKLNEMKSKAEPQKTKSRLSVGFLLIIFLLLVFLTCAVAVTAFIMYKKYASQEKSSSPIEQFKNVRQAPKPRGGDEPTADKKEEKRDKPRW